MYLWFAASVDDYYDNLKEKVEKVKKDLDFYFGTNGLPWHISLKISFEVPKGKEEAIINDLSNYFKTLKPFKVNPKCIDKENNILWVRYYDNENLSNISSYLNKMLNEKYQIKYHEFDNNFIMHSTLFMSDDKSIIDKGYLLLKDEALPKELLINKFVIGTSPEGKPETYSVIKEIAV